MKTLIVFFVIVYSLTLECQVHVSGYTKSNGTYVAPYTRSSPNSTATDNYSYPGNTNPYTGKTASGNTDTYINNLYNGNSTSKSSDVWVNGYYRSDGTYVNGYYRSAPNGNPYDNYSYPGNTNPYTGKTATGNPNTYLKNYSGNSNSSYSTTYYVRTNSLNLRSGPSKNFPVIGSLNYGNDVQVIEKVNSLWTKVNITYYDNYTLKTKIGYVYSDYLTSNNPSSNLNYSSNSNHPFGNNKGQITFWTNCPDDGEISVYVNGEYKGLITSYYYENSTPDCFSSGTLGIILPVGTYNITAYGNEKSWKTSVTVIEDECSIERLSK